MSYKPVSVDREGDKTIFMYEGVALSEMPKKFKSFMASEGYRIESGDEEKGVYGTGSNAMRILFGAFVKRYTFQFRFTGTGQTCRLEFATNMTGISGGVIGYNKMKKENQRLVDRLAQTTL